MPLRIQLFGFQELINLLDRLANALEAPQAGWEHVRDEVRSDIRQLFEDGGRGQWSPWRPWTVDWRNLRRGNYGRPGPVLDRIGVWTGALRGALTSDTDPGYHTISGRTLEMGIRRIEDRRYDVFIQGRPDRAGIALWEARRYGYQGRAARVYRQEPRAVFENLGLEADTEQNPIIRGLTDWLVQDFGFTR